MDKKRLTREYSPSSCVGDVAPYIQEYGDLSRVACEVLGPRCRKDVKYGPEPRSAVDIFMPEGIGPFPVHVFIHGGYWQELSREESSFAAPNFTRHNIIFIALDYSLAPGASLYQIVEQTRRGICWILDNIDQYGGDKDNVTLSGNSAGAHLVAEVLSMDWQEQGYDPCPLRAACMISGIFDLRPLVDIYVNEPLDMTAADAVALSPYFHIPAHSCPVIFSFGGHETGEFKRQTRDYMTAWQKADNSACFIDMPTFNHFDIILELASRHSPLFKAVLARIISP